METAATTRAIHGLHRRPVDGAHRAAAPRHRPREAMRRGLDDSDPGPRDRHRTTHTVAR
jgi:hypothetical protein